VPDGDHDGWVTRGYLFICLHPAEPVLETCDSSGAALSQKVGARAQVIRGGPELPRAARRDPESRGHMVALELP
jgi:hypothetical protein